MAGNLGTVNTVSSITGEVWRPVPGYHGFYEVSDHGRVRGLPRVVAHSIPGRTRSAPGKVLDQETDKKGRKIVRLSRDGKPRRRRVHTLVLEAFVGPCPAGMEGCHNNGDPTDNRPGNLRWDTRSSNQADAVAHGTHHNSSKTRCVKFGHQLIHPNLCAGELARGGRSCLACQRGRSEVRNHALRGVVVDLQEASDRHYELIMSDDKRGE